MSTCERYADHGDGIVLVTGATGLLGDHLRRTGWRGVAGLAEEAA